MGLLSEVFSVVNTLISPNPAVPPADPLHLLAFEVVRRIEFALGMPVVGVYHNLAEISLQAALAATVHVTAMLVVMAVVAVAVYEKFGLGILRRGWFNLDLGWSLVLVGSGALTLFTQ